MSNMDAVLPRNAAFAAKGEWRNTPRLPFLPKKGLYVITCVDPRVDPFEFLGLEFADAIVGRTVGGRITPGMIQDVAYIGYLVEQKAPEGPYFEVAVIHHTQCGSRLLEDEALRHGFAERTGYDERVLAGLPATDPVKTVRADVELLLAAPQISDSTAVSGHVYDVESGLVTTVIDATRAVADARAEASSP
jgi:carbonic anhydrase